MQALDGSVLAPSGERVVPGFCVLCKSRCGALYTVRDNRITKVEPDLSHPAGDALCAKGRSAAEIAGHPGRLFSPLRRTSPKGVLPPRWETISWEEALREIAEKINSAATQFGPNSVALQTASPSATPLSDSFEWLLRLFRRIGSANVVANSENCNWHKDVTHAFTFGASTPPADWLASRVGMLWGHNPAKTWLAQSSLIAQARAKGMRLIVVDPRRSTSALDADLWLRITPGTDAALALWAIRELSERGAYDDEFIRRWSNAPFLVDPRDGSLCRPSQASGEEAGGDGEHFLVWNEATAAVETVSTAVAAENWREWSLEESPTVSVGGVNTQARTVWSFLMESCAPWDDERASALTGIPVEDLHRFAELLIEGMPSISYHAWTGISQHSNATQTERSIACLYALLGGFDRRGGNVQLSSIPVRPVVLPLSEESKRTSLGAAKHPLGMVSAGMITADELQDAVLGQDSPYPIKALLSFGGNPLLTQTSPERAAATLSKIDFYAHVDLFHNPSNDYADILLPAASMYEFDSVRAGWELTQDGVERLQYRPQIVPRVGEARSDAEIIFSLAQALGFEDEFFSLGLDKARDKVLEPLGVTLAELKEKGSVRIPLPRAYEKYRESGFNTPSRRVELYSETLKKAGHSPVPEFSSGADGHDGFPYHLTCAKDGYYCHSQHRGVGSLRKRSRDPNVFVSPAVAERHGLSPGLPAQIRTRNGSATLIVSLDEYLADNVVVCEFGWWEGNLDLGLPRLDPLSPDGSNFNALVSGEASDPVVGSARFRSARCAIGPLPEPKLWSGRKAFVVCEARNRADGIRSIVLRPADNTALPDFLPGQHLPVLLPGKSEQERKYSLTGPAAQAEGTYEIAVKKIPGGEVSPLVHELAVGDVVECGPPSGTFTIPHADHPLPLVFIAIGVGITPFMSALRTLAHRTEPSRWPRVELVYCAKDSDNLAYEDEIARIAELLGDALRMTVYLSRQAGGSVAGVKHYSAVFRRLRSEDFSDELIARGARFYYCGPVEAGQAFKRDLVARGLGAHQFFTESFYAPPAVAELPTNDATVVFERSGKTARWRAAEGKTLLELAESNGINAPSGCRLGQCESCAAPVAHGTVMHRVPVSEEYDQTADCLTCQALPLGDVTIQL